MLAAELAVTVLEHVPQILHPINVHVQSMTASYNHRTWWVLPLLHVPKYPGEIFHGWLGLNHVHVRNYNNSQIEIFSHESAWDEYYYHALCFFTSIY